MSLEPKHQLTSPRQGRVTTIHFVAYPKPRGHSCFFASHPSANLGVGEPTFQAILNLTTALPPPRPEPWLHLAHVIAMAEVVPFICTSGFPRGWSGCAGPWMVSHGFYLPQSFLPSSSRIARGRSWPPCQLGVACASSGHWHVSRAIQEPSRLQQRQMGVALPGLWLFPFPRGQASEVPVLSLHHKDEAVAPGESIITA